VGIGIKKTNGGIVIRHFNPVPDQKLSVLDRFRYRHFVLVQYRTDRMPDGPVFRHFELQSRLIVHWAAGAPSITPFFLKYECLGEY
jgi:hypothetical protein